MDKKYTIYTHITLFSSTEAMSDKVPYLVAVVADEDDNKVSAKIEGFELGMDIKIGMPVYLKTNDETGETYFSL